ncbi:hypothetical protein K490DRAFT_46426 [Saccharata proteae CBS 121410]|uniref:RING-type E3 ubiquitin transferase n=1 Tax=Saccharata proteae CBS 121410 TaxID=1314787 RepID=A0A9P4HUF2_9PEZI|nr:hypothetical protein K490DRAFT_46426 [Saccharata proteae CBS 121410]
MNDPAYDPGSASSDKPSDDPDTCRICRGEGTREEPLFYPCKCSGSIKFVHQECLMEWLSHSQKKHCELCKTPFRFTKLYHPQMPTRLPTAIFLRRAVVHMFNHLLTWCRGLLVGSVWLLWLPWCMRIIWRALFWCGDGGFADDLQRVASIQSTGSSAATSIAALATNVSTTGNVSSGPAIAGVWQSLNVSAAEPTAYMLMKGFLFGWWRGYLQFLHTSAADATANSTVVELTQHKHPSLLSDVSFLTKFSPHPSLNRLVLDIVEGQIITVLVVIAFILIFLIREWVVQQQPIMNVAAMDPFIRPPPVAPVEAEMQGAEHQPVEDADHGDVDMHEDTEEDEHHEDDERASRKKHKQAEDMDEIEPNRQSNREIREDNDRLEEEFGDDGRDGPARSVPHSVDMLETDPENSSSQQRPNMPGRERSFLATEIRRDLEESNRNLSTPEDPPLAASDDQDGERGSNNSMESWQQVSETEVGDQGLVSTNAHAQDELREKGHQEPADASSSTAAEDVKSGRSGGTPDASTSAPPTGRGTSTEQDTPEARATMEAHPPINNERRQDESATTTGNDRPNGQHARPEGLLEWVIDWLWGDVAPLDNEDNQGGADDDHVVQNLADEAPFVQRAAGIDDFEHDAGPQDPDVAAAAAQAGIDVNDVEAVEDAEDLEGILELIGMQGPLIGLFQNALFSAVLISATVALAVWLPYLWGKIVLLSLGRPIWLFVKLPLRLLSATADLIVDVMLFFGAALVYWTMAAVRSLLPAIKLSESLDSLNDSTKDVAEAAIERMSKILSVANTGINSDYLHLSLSSHAALRSIQSEVGYWTSNTYSTALEAVQKISNVESFSVFGALRHTVNAGFALGAYAINSLRAALPTISTENGFSLKVETSNTTSIAVDSASEYWTATDRFIAIFAGYTFFAVAGALYLRRGTPFTSSTNGRKVEGVISDILQQAGGVLKVILIISIEMIAFPLYCGILLDGALLPLFEHASPASRLAFAQNSPWTAGFMHWFVGTCYMFHFALFVSMCRKIMRTGVLYFIRDPDDPTFHPVRDVLERSVTSQLRKIAFSAFVYGALVICCLGGVVWGLAYCSDDILPIHWATSDPSLEFPLDLLFFNFLTPIVIKLFKPSDGLHAMYQWWFRKCARALRLSDFLFGEKHQDELVYFLFDGRYVRAPASDQARIPRGQSVFVNVDVFDNRLDGRAEDEGIHGRNSGMTTTVYVPPWFRIRICLFVITIWAFAAATGVGVTIIPLIFGRHLFSYVLPMGTRFNDIYAFAVGIYILGSISYALLHFRTLGRIASSTLRHPFSTTYDVLATGAQYFYQALKLCYVYGALVVLLPVLFATFLEFYILIPLHAYVGPGETHVIHVVQDWTLGFLYARIAARILLANRQSVIARALQAVVRDGYLEPNARLATRCFILPIGVFFATTLLAPLLLAGSANATWFANADEAVRGKVYTLVYPLTLAVVLSTWTAYCVVQATERWRQRIKDEVYLIGERLHNLGERKAGPAVDAVLAA